MIFRCPTNQDRRIGSSIFVRHKWSSNEWVMAKFGRYRKRLRNKSTSNPAFARRNSDGAQYSNTPIPRLAGFEDSLSDEAFGLSARSSVSQRSRKDENEAPQEPAG